jgi:signal transduction histidine kinase
VGFAVTTAPDADRGFASLARGRFDLVLSDLLLPGDSGFDLCRRIKTDPRYRQVPVVVLTGQADPANVLRGLEAGADGFMTKDREPEEIVRGIRRILEGSRHPASADVPVPLRVAFLNQEYEVSADREQLLNVLAAAFEDVVHLNERAQADAAELATRARSERQAHEELRRAHETLKQTQSQLVQAEKLSSLGQLVAGVAHEINNPLSFVSNNIVVLQRDLRGLRELIQLYRQAETTLAGHNPELLASIRTKAEQFDLAYTLENLERVMTRSREGLRRIQHIVKDLKDFARLDESERQEADVNAGIQSTVNIVEGHASQQKVVLTQELEPLPPITCYPAKLNQVVLNLLANAIDACPPGGKVTVRSRATPREAEIEVADTGCGIDPSICDRIFDPFFTTKPLGKGTGLGLSISYGIVRAHGGSIAVESTPGQGTCFTVRLPREASANGD